MNPGLLVLPAVRWRPQTGFSHEEGPIGAALDAGVGGFIVFGVPGARGDEIAEVVETIRRRAGRPLLIGADLERGMGQQARRLTQVPPPAALSSLGDDEAVAWAARTTAREARSLGINWVFAPVADLDLEPENPIVQTRSFGAEPGAVARQVEIWVRAAQAEGVLACAKHYPGHGRTRQDSHDVLPVVDASLEELAVTDLRPFAAAVNARVASVMTAHVAYPRWDPSGAAATRSAPILAHLREQLRFDGLIVTDALTMAAARASLAPEEALVAPIRAGCDLLLYPPDAGAAVTALANALERDPTLEALATAATDRYRQALARTASTPAPEDVPIPDPRGREYALRLLDRGMVRGVAPDLRGGVEIVVVDDDAGGAHPPGPSDLVRRRLALEGAAEAFGGHRVVLAFAEPRMSKGRAGFGPESLALLQRSARDAALVVVFGHPRLGEQVPGSAPVLLAWHRQPLMQEAVADWLLARMR